MLMPIVIVTIVLVGVLLVTLVTVMLVPVMIAAVFLVSVFLIRVLLITFTCIVCCSCALSRQCGDECADGCFVGGISVGAAACCCEFFQLFADGFVGVEANNINGDIAVALVNVAGNLSHLWRRAGVNAIRNQHDVTLVLFCLLCVQGLFGREECRADRGVSAGNQAVDLGSNFVARTTERHQGLDVFTTSFFFFVAVSGASTVGQQSKLLVTRQFAEEGVCHTVGSVGA